MYATDVPQYKEFGSEYHWINYPGYTVTNCVPPDALLFSTGRAALISLLRYGIKQYKWKRIWLPQYFCPEVITALRTPGIDVAYYYDSPLDFPSIPENLDTGDIILITNHFGLRTASAYREFYGLGVPLIEDHSHDPWSRWAQTSIADFAVASYRKVLPIPDGAGLWSPKGKDIAGCHADNTAQISDKLQAMLLKYAYLAYSWPVKDAYLALYHGYAASLGSSCSYISALSRNMLIHFPWEVWRQKRRRNYTILRKNIRATGEVHVAGPLEEHCCPYSFIVIFATKPKREKIKESLIQKAIYPAVLWPVPWPMHKDLDHRIIDLSERMLSIHIDGRYTEGDMEYISSVIGSLI